MIRIKEMAREIKRLKRQLTILTLETTNRIKEERLKRIRNRNRSTKR